MHVVVVVTVAYAGYIDDISGLWPRILIGAEREMPPIPLTSKVRMARVVHAIYCCRFCETVACWRRQVSAAIRKYLLFGVVLYLTPHTFFMRYLMCTTGANADHNTDLIKQPCGVNTAA